MSTVLNLTYKVFKGVDLEPVVFLYEKGKFSVACDVANVRNRSEFGSFKLNKVDAEIWRRDADFRFLIQITKKNSGLIEQLEKQGVPLGTLFQVKAGLKAYERGKGKPVQSPKDVENRIYDFHRKISTDCFRYLDGGDVKPFKIEWGKTWLKYGENLAAPRTFDLFSEPRLLIREITGKYPRSLICTYTEEVFLNNLSIINVLPQVGKTDSEDLKILLLILSSKLMSFYFKKKTAKAERKLFPKLILGDLKAFPIVMPGKKERQSFLRIAAALLSSADSNDESSLRHREKLFAVLDELVLRLYEVSGDDANLIQDVA